MKALYFDRFVINKKYVVQHSDAIGTNRLKIILKLTCEYCIKYRSIPFTVAKKQFTKYTVICRKLEI